MKFSIFDKRVVIKCCSSIFTFGGAIIGVISALFSNWVSKNSFFILMVWGFLWFLYYFFILFKEHRMDRLVLKINDSEVEIINGDILRNCEDDSLRVIAFNEYFDTLVYEKIISSGSINGKFLNTLTDNELNELDDFIKNNNELSDRFILQNVNRKRGKKKKYKIGSILCYKKNYLLTAFSKFDEKDRANLTLAEYIEFLMEFWNEIDRVYAGRTVELPLLGGGITRFKDTGNSLSHQELIENILWTFKISRLKFSYPAKIRILLYKDEKVNEIKKIDLIKLKEMFKNE